MVDSDRYAQILRDLTQEIEENHDILKHSSTVASTVQALRICCKINKDDKMIDILSFMNFDFKKVSVLWCVFFISLGNGIP